MESVYDILRETECHFTWGLSDLGQNRTVILNKSNDLLEESQIFREEDQCREDQYFRGWLEKLTIIYELGEEDRERSIETINDVIQFLLTCSDGIISKYRSSCLHVAYSFKAFFVLNILKNEESVEGCISCIKPVKLMLPEEISPILASRALVLRYYGLEGLHKSLPLLITAVSYSDEIEWKISQLISQCMINRSSEKFVERQELDEFVESIKKVLTSVGISNDQKRAIKYTQAVALHDYLSSNAKYEVLDRRDRMSTLMTLAKELNENTDSPSVRLFCAQIMYKFGENVKGAHEEALKIANSILEKKPNHTIANTVASKIYLRMKNFKSAAGHAQIAMTRGGFGAAWILLRCKVDLGQNFDDEEFFDTLLSSTSKYFIFDTHVKASLFYLIAKRDIFKGTKHIVKLLQLETVDPTRNFYCEWAETTVNPLEIAYNQIVLSLRRCQDSAEKTKLYREAKKLIEETVDCRRFVTNENMVEELLKLKNKKKRSSNSNGRAIH